jgi:hypothetical protein
VVPAQRMVPCEWRFDRFLATSQVYMANMLANTKAMISPSGMSALEAYLYLCRSPFS